MSFKDHLGVISATLGCGAAIAGLAYTLQRRSKAPVATSGALSERTLDLHPYIDKASRELSSKSLRQIQVETALTWGGRACAAARMDRMDDAREYAHEALEHAALSGDDGLLSVVRGAMRSSGVDF